MTTTLQIPRQLLSYVHADLSRPHAFAAERVGFIACTALEAPSGNVTLLANEYLPVADDHYVDAPRVGAMMSSAAIRTALEYAYAGPISMFHVHRHEHYGGPRFSRVDLNGYAQFVPNFWHVQPKLPHGALLLSHDSAIGLCWHPEQKRVAPVDIIKVIDSPAGQTEKTRHG